MPEMDTDVRDVGPAPLIAVFGRGFKSSDFNDDVLAMTLDKTYAGGAKKVFCHAALKSLLQEGLSSDILHADTTARLFYGDYPAEKDLKISYGHNKERRRDLKQFKLGLKFISRLPATFDLAHVLTLKAFSDDNSLRYI